MNLRNLFRVTAAFTMLTGLLWLLAPEATVASYGLNLDAYGAYLVQILGTFNIALAVLAFLASRMEHSQARQAVVTAFLVQQALSGIVNLLAVLGSVVPGGAGWFGVAFNIVFTLAFGYFRFVNPEASMKPRTQP
jgi:hypothetical protein